MHELGLCADVVAAIERRAKDRRVSGATVRVGRLHHVHPDAFDQSFAVAAAGTVADGAAVRLVLVPVRMRCAACGEEPEGDEVLAACPSCGAVELALTGGDELVLESITYGAPRGPDPAAPRVPDPAAADHTRGPDPAAADHTRGTRPTDARV